MVLTSTTNGSANSNRVCFEVDSARNDPYIVLAYSESPFFTDRQCDSTNDLSAHDSSVKLTITHKGTNCVGTGYSRGAFKYLTVFIPEEDCPTTPDKDSVDTEQSLYEAAQQKFLGGKIKLEQAAIAISKVWVNCTAFPSNTKGRAYTGYFDSSSSVLNRVWYAGVWTLQLSTVDPKEGGSIVDFKRIFDPNTPLQGALDYNYTMASGGVLNTDGAKQDRLVWPGDMTTAVAGIAVSTYDMLAVRNALDIIYRNQYDDGSMPYWGPPISLFGEFSDTYHLCTLIGTYEYVLYSGDLDWLRTKWGAYKRALEASIRKVDETGLLHVPSVFDWVRPGMMGHNVEASALLYQVLGNSVQLAQWIVDKHSIEWWWGVQKRLRKGIPTLYCEQDGLFSDSTGKRGCNGPEKVLPQDGPSWVLLSNVIQSQSVR